LRWPAAIARIDGALLRGWTSEKRGSKRDSKTVRRAYTRDTVAGWFRVFRTMTRDAMAALQLPRDSTLRIVLPEASADDEESNALTPAELAAFLDAMKVDYPQHYPLVVLLAYTGLRFCHASALHWDDWDAHAGVLRLTARTFEAGSALRRGRSARRRSTRCCPSSPKS
jgi:integrase